MFKLLTPLTYWLLTAVWACVLYFCITRLRHRKIQSAFFATALLILMVDAIRTLFESTYFGTWRTAQAGLLPIWITHLLSRPEMVFIPKIVNLAAGTWIAFVLFKKWLPLEEVEHLRIEQYIKELESKTEEQRQTELALRQSEEQFRNIVESSPMGIHLYTLHSNGDMIFTGANSAADSFMGIDHAPLIGKRIEEAFPTLEFSEIPNQYKDACAFGRPWQTEDIRYRNGRIESAFQVTAFRTMPGQIAVQFLDITERKQIEESLTLTQFTVDNAAVSIFWITPNGSFTYVNNAACEMFGYPRDRLLTMSVPDLTPDSSIRTMVWEKLKAIHHMTFEITGLKQDGTTFPMEVTSHYIRFEEQEFEFAFILDRSKRKQAERTIAELNQNLEKLIIERTRDLEHKAAELETANIRLTEVDRLKSALLSTVSHELKTPLTSIIGYTKLTHRDFSRDFLPLTTGNTSLAKRSTRLSENLSVISDEASRLLRLIDNFLILSKIKAGTAFNQRQPLDMHAIIQRAIGLSQSYFTAYPDVSLEVNIPAELPQIMGDPDSLTQVLLNLLDNGAKFSTKGAVRLTADTTIADTIRIMVSDEGPGIPEEEHDKIFETFHQIFEDNDCHIKPPGAGLGLSICKQIVNAINGDIWVECPNSGGCTFIVKLPVATPEEIEAFQS